MAIPYSVLDLATVGEGSTSPQALQDTIELARRTEELGYTRFWVAEHHNMPGIASSSPPVLIASIAAATSHIRVGSGGVMLPNHAPLVVAEQFGMLEALHPGRIDLGLGRAPGTDPRTAHALRRSPSPLSADDFPEQLSELISYFGTDPQGIAAVPASGNKPPVWLLGSSGYSAQLSGMLGMPFAFAHHFSAQNTLPALALYRQNFRPSATLDKPYAMVAASVICAETDEQAQYLAGPGALAFLKLRSGRPGLMPTPEEAAAYPYTPLERQMIEARTADQIIGSPETVERGIEKLLAETEADELMIVSMVHGAEDRRRSYELVAKLRGAHQSDQGADIDG